MNQINEKIVDLKTKLEEDQNQRKDNSNSDSKSENPNRGIVLMDTTTCPQDIAYPTDLNRLNNAREKSEMLIDIFYQKNFTVKSHELTEKKHELPILILHRKSVKWVKLSVKA